MPEGPSCTETPSAQVAQPAQVALQQVQRRFFELTNEAARRRRQIDQAHKSAQEDLNRRERELDHAVLETGAHERFIANVDRWYLEAVAPSSRSWKLLEECVPTRRAPAIIEHPDGIAVADHEVLDAMAGFLNSRGRLDWHLFIPEDARTAVRLQLSVIEGMRQASGRRLDELESSTPGWIEEIHRLRDEIADSHSRAEADLRSWYEQQVQVWRQDCTAIELGASARTWKDPHWEAWEPPRAIEPILLGEIIPKELAASIGVDVARTPLEVIVDLRQLGNLRVPVGAGRQDFAINFLRNFAIRALAAFPPGQLRLAIIDPIGMGDTVAPILTLGDHDPELLSGRPASSGPAIHALLSDLTAHIERVIQRYLRGQYATIEEYNAVAGETAEAYRLVLINDYPAQFDDQSLHLLQRIMEKGPQCGVFTVVAFHTDQPEGYYGPRPDQLPQNTPVFPKGCRLPGMDIADLDVKAALTYYQEPAFHLGAEAAQRLIGRIVNSFGRESGKVTNTVTTLQRTQEMFSRVLEQPGAARWPSGTQPALLADPGSWWRNSAGGAIVAPLGPSGAQDVAVLRLDSGTESGVLMVGRPGSGKSTLIHTYLAALTTLYSPLELSLYLLDFKEGVEFAGYAQQALPHARCIAVESERELGVSVLESIKDEMQRRSRLFKECGDSVSGYHSYRQVSQQPLPRIVLVFDEFQVLFTEHDRIGYRAAELLETIIRQGRGFGVHVLLGSQSLSGMTVLNKAALQMLNVRILLSAAEEDSQLTLAPGNLAYRQLSKRGEAILNTAGGTTEANIPFTVAYEEPQARTGRLRVLREMADRSGFTARPRVFRGDMTASLSDADPARFGAGGKPLAPTLTLGQPTSLGSALTVELARRQGKNLLIVSRAQETILDGLTAAATCSTLAAPQTRIELVAFTASPLTDDLLPRLAGPRFTLHRHRELGDRLQAVLSEIERRENEEDRTDTPVLLILHGIQRARDLEVDAGAGFFDDAETGGAHDLLGSILRRGPELGVHTVVTADSMIAVGRRLGNLVREFDLRVGGAMRKDDLNALMGELDLAEVRETQALLVDAETGSRQKFLPYSTPSPEWVDAFGRRLHEDRED